jgi:hypothetical protein
MIQTLNQECANYQAKLDAWRGVYARFWEFSPSLDRLAIRLTAEGRPGNLQVTCSPCVFIQGPVHWDPCDLRLVREERDGDQLYVLRDESAGVEVACRGVVIDENVEPVY